MATGTENMTGSWKFPGSMDELPSYVNIYDQNMWLSAFFAVFTPAAWNLVGIIDHNSRYFTNLFGGNPKLACVSLSFIQIFFSNLRGFFFHRMILNQLRFETPFNDVVTIIGYTSIAIGVFLVGTSFLRLGYIGTYQGDHFGILMDDKITDFPFNVLNHPMYIGSSMIFVGKAIYERSLAALVLTNWIHLTHVGTVLIEAPFTERIYSEAAQKAQGKKKK